MYHIHTTYFIHPSILHPSIHPLSSTHLVIHATGVQTCRQYACTCRQNRHSSIYRTNNELHFSNALELVTAGDRCSYLSGRQRSDTHGPPDGLCGRHLTRPDLSHQLRQAPRHLSRWGRDRTHVRHLTTPDSYLARPDLSHQLRQAARHLSRCQGWKVTL